MSGAVETTVRAADEMARKTPALTDALEHVMAEMLRQPLDVAERRDLEAWKRRVADAWAVVREAVAEVHAMSGRVLAEQRADRAEMAQLRARVETLEAQLREWQREYEPDSDPRRPAFFSNLRRALHAFRG
jgi:hypothetical protein